jgi:hypothetical protein
MTSKEKAQELVDSYRIILMNEDTECGNEILCTLIAKQCALIAVDEIIKDWINRFKELKEEQKIKHSLDEMIALSSSINYWNDVKHEIHKL